MAVALALVAPAHASWTASGTFTYRDRDYDQTGFTGIELPQPIRLADIEIVDSNGNGPNAMLASVVTALDVLAEQIEDRTFQQILQKLRDDVEAGAGLSEAMARHPRVFSEFFINMVKAGESSGHLDEILDRVATYVEKTETLMRKVKASLFYPAFVSILAFCITSFLVMFIVPQFRDIFSSLGGELPLPTQMLLNLSDFMRAYLVVEIFLLAGAIFALRMYAKTAVGRLMIDRLKLRIIVIGDLLQKVAIARFARTLATLTNSGVPITNRSLT